MKYAFMQMHKSPNKYEMFSFKFAFFISSQLFEFGYVLKLFLFKHLCLNSP